MELETGHWRLGTRHWMMETGNWRLRTGDCELVTGDWAVETGHGDWELETSILGAGGPTQAVGISLFYGPKRAITIWNMYFFSIVLFVYEPGHACHLYLYFSNSWTQSNFV